jgi:tRNA-Thr(GGU) m(6)t(6)A37 methyltransferase TsaA
MQSYSVKPIGVVKTDYTEASLTLHEQDLALDEEILTRTKTGKGSISELIIDEEYADCLEGIEDFSHVMVLYWSHRINDHERHITRVHPAGKKEYPLVGIFATRSPARPNPICATTVELIGRTQNVLKVKNLDAIDGSPIIDIKAHSPSYDSPPNVKQAEWMERLMAYFREKVRFSHLLCGKKAIRNSFY